MSDPQGRSVDPERLRRDLLQLAEFIQKMDRERSLLNAAPRLLKLMGDLRSALFEYEVRHTGRLLPKPVPPGAEPDSENEPPAVRESRRIVQEAIERQREAEREWERGASEEDEEPPPGG